MSTEEASYDNVTEDEDVEEEKPAGVCSKGRKKMALNLLLVGSYVAVGVIVMMMNGCCGCPLVPSDHLQNQGLCQSRHQY